MAEKPRKPTSFPKLFTVFSFKSFSEADTVSSPTSILDSKPFSVLKTPFWFEPPTAREPETRHRVDPKGIGLAILDETGHEPSSRTVLFGSNLRVQIPPHSDFGTKTRNLRRDSMQSGKYSGYGLDNSGPQSPSFSVALSPREMEMSEDYTCVICHGPNPKTTHIFDGFVLESCGTGRVADARGENGSAYPSESFLSSCYSCKKNLGPGKDIFMYRGEKAFCSTECREQEMAREEGLERLTLERDDGFGTRACQSCELLEGM